MFIKKVREKWSVIWAYLLSSKEGNLQKILIPIVVVLVGALVSIYWVGNSQSKEPKPRLKRDYVSIGYPSFSPADIGSRDLAKTVQGMVVAKVNASGNVAVPAIEGRLDYPRLNLQLRFEEDKRDLYFAAQNAKFVYYKPTVYLVAQQYDPKGRAGETYSSHRSKEQTARQTSQGEWVTLVQEAIDQLIIQR